MTAERSPAKSLPLKNKLNAIFISSIVIAVLLAVITISGLLYPASFYPTLNLRLFSIPTDIISLFVCLPILVLSMLLAQRSNLVGLLCWPGTLLYITYIYIIYILSQPFNVLFIPYLLLFVVSVYTLVALIASIDAVAVRQQLKGSVPARTAGIILTIMSAFFILVQVGELVNALINGIPKELSDLAPFVSDFITVAPAWLLGGIMLWRDKALGYAAGTGLLLLGTILFGGLAFVIAFPAMHDQSPIDIASVVMMLLMGAVCFIPLLLFIRNSSPAAAK